jgi:hypothetical protein
VAEHGGGIVAFQADGECGAFMADAETGGRLWLRHGGVFHPSVPPRPDSWRGQSFGLPRFGGRWRSPIHMPRRLSRLVLEITEVRVERLQAITAADACAECDALSILTQRHGTPDHPLRAAAYSRGDDVHDDEGEPHPDGPFAGAREAFAALWDSLNAKRGFGWDANPWVWVLSFRRGEP